MTHLEQRLARIIEDAKAGLHDSTEETVEFILQALADPGWRHDYEPTYLPGRRDDVATD